MVGVALCEIIIMTFNTLAPLSAAWKTPGNKQKLNTAALAPFLDCLHIQFQAAAMIKNVLGERGLRDKQTI